MERTLGPKGLAGFPTVSGTAHGKAVHWLVDEARANQLESDMTSSSRLNQLLTRNAYTLEGLTAEERQEAVWLARSEPESDFQCCCKKRSVGDTGLCRRHLVYALRKRI